MNLVELVAVGLAVGLLVGMTGMGGGALLTPILVLVFGIAPSAAVGSDLAVSLAMKPVGALVHHRAGTVNWTLVKWLLPTAVPAAFSGAYLLSLVADTDTVELWLRWGIGLALFAGVSGLIVQSVVARKRPSPGGPADATSVVVRPIATLAVGLLGGLVVGFTSVGSGSLIIVLLVLLHPRMRASELVGTDLVQAIPLVGAATLGHLLFGEVDFSLTAGLLIGALPGTYLGARFSTRVAGDITKMLIGSVLTGSALALWDVPPLGIATGVVVHFGAAWALARGRRVRGSVVATGELTTEHTAGSQRSPRQLSLPDGA